MRAETAGRLIVLGVVMSGAVLLHAQEGGLQWVAAASGAVPVGAVAYGRNADGGAQYVCRASLDGGLHIGRIAAGLSGCSIGYRRREMVLPSYEVLARSPRIVAVRPELTAVRNRGAIDVVFPAHIQPPRTPASIPPTPPDSSVKRGFDDNGRPYVEVRLPDGTIKRTDQNGGVTLVTPDGTSQYIPPSVARANAPAPTPPALPSDPRQGRVWVERHNDDLLELIRNLVRRDETEMKKFSDGEQQAAPDDLFKQIAYRTKIADFLAMDR